jgi:hypothetical protein
MDSLNFNTNVDNDITPDISQMLQALELFSKKMSTDIQKNITPIIDKFSKQVFDSLSLSLEKSLVKPLNEIKTQIVIPVAALENMKKAMDYYVKSLNIPQGEKEIEVEFSDEQLETLEAVHIPVDDYAKPSTSDKNKKTMSIKALSTVILLVIAILNISSDCVSLNTALVENNTAIINNDTAHTEYQTAIVNNDTAKLQSQSQDDQVEQLSKIVVNLIDTYNQATADEITSN